MFPQGEVEQVINPMQMAPSLFFLCPLIQTTKVPEVSRKSSPDNSLPRFRWRELEGDQSYQSGGKGEGPLSSTRVVSVSHRPSGPLFLHNKHDLEPLV